MSISLAKKKLKDVDSVFLPVDKSFYTEISNSIMKSLRRHADLFEQVSIDEAYLDVTARTKANYQRATDLAVAIKKEIFRKKQLTCSIGVGSNKLVAKISADFQKPDGLTVVEPIDIERFLVSLSVRSLVGVGKKTEKKLEILGIRTIGQLAKVDVQELIDVFGRKMGAYFHNASLGLDEDPVQERGEPDSVSRISTLKEDTRDLNVILNEAYKLCEDVYAMLLQRGMLFRSVSIHVVASNLNSYSRSKTFENPTSMLGVFKTTVKELFEKFLDESDVEARRVGVKLSSLTKKEILQKPITSFFDSSN